MNGGLRIVLYAQHLSGVGHLVRTLEIGKALCGKHQVWLLDGGKPLPRRHSDKIHRLSLPRLCRRDGRLSPLDSPAPIEQLMQARAAALTEAIRGIRPHLLVIEHYPFSKWELSGEIATLMQAARAAHPALKTVCSVRDIPLQTRHEACSPVAYAERVVQTLNHSFDALLVHADPKLSRLQDYFPAVGRIAIPVKHTGIVAETVQPQADSDAILGDITGGKPFVMAAAGGGTDSEGLLRRVTEAWAILQGAGQMQNHKLLLFDGLDAGQTSIPQPHPENAAIIRLPFNPDYLSLMQSCALSVSSAGYNTAANILRSGCPAILVANRSMSDQTARVRIMAGLGYKAFSELPDAADLAEAMLENLGKSGPEHAVDLDGAGQSAVLMEAMLSSRQ